jgi:hypothetical protein
MVPGRASNPIIIPVKIRFIAMVTDFDFRAGYSGREKTLRHGHYSSVTPQHFWPNYKIVLFETVGREFFLLYAIYPFTDFKRGHIFRCKNQNKFVEIRKRKKYGEKKPVLLVITDVFTRWP